VKGGVSGGRGQQPAPSFASGLAAARVPREGVPEMMAEDVLDNGVHVLTERIPGVRSASVGVWIRQGGAHERIRDTGASHLLEHMVFKGTQQRSAAEIAIALEGLGGSLDAYTSREHTSYLARVLDENLPEALDVLADLVLAPLLRQEDLDMEREVVLEEIAQVEDTPDDLVYELHGEAMWGGHPYGRSILGTKASVGSMTADTLRALHERRYRGENLIVAAAGNVDHGAFVDAVSGLFGAHETTERNGAVAVPSQTVHGEMKVERSSAQTHVVFGTGVPGHDHPDRYALVLLSSALGGGMSSRLFQRVREELGLCYSVYSYQSFYSVGGVSGVYVGTRPATADQAVEAIREELASVAATGLGEDELEQTKRQVKGQVMLSLESTGARLHRLASFALHEEPFLGLDGLLARIEAVTVEDIGRVAENFFHPEAQMVLRLGPGSSS
jgi:predicted Zn-dependent peptidase